MTASGTSLNTPQQHADGGPDRLVQHDRPRSARRDLVRHDRSSRSRPAFASATPGETSSTVLAATRSTSRCSARSRWAVSGGSSSELEAGNILNHAGLRQPEWEHHVRHVRTDHRHQRQLPGTADSDSAFGSSSRTSRVNVSSAATSRRSSHRRNRPLG